jgi:hypothetical protein
MTKKELIKALKDIPDDALISIGFDTDDRTIERYVTYVQYWPEHKDFCLYDCQ